MKPALNSKTFLLRAIAAAMLLFNGTGALYGGYSLINDPTGGGLQLPFEYLKPGIFTDYFIPGLILFVFNGIGSLLAAFYTIGHFSKYYLWVLAQGLILIVWIIVQLFMVTHVYYLQFILGGLGLMLILLALLLKRKEEQFLKLA